MGGPNDITRGKDGTFTIAEQEDGDQPAYVCVRDAAGNVLARMPSRHVHGVGVDSRGDIYAGLTVDRSVDKFVPNWLSRRQNRENVMMISKRGLLASAAGLAAGAGLRPLRAQPTKLRFGVGPLLPSPTDTIKAYTPIFDYLAKQLGVEYSLVSTTDWAGMAVAMGSGNSTSPGWDPGATSSPTTAPTAPRLRP